MKRILVMSLVMKMHPIYMLCDSLLLYNLSFGIETTQSGEEVKVMHHIFISLSMF